MHARHELLARPLDLPCGRSLPNRLAKSAMSEQLGDAQGRPTPELGRLYRRWADGGAGLVITGNVMIDGAHLGEPRNVVLEDERHLAAFTAWVDAACAAGGPAPWIQLNHPGRQAPRYVTAQPVAPSAVPLAPAGIFAAPRALAAAEIEAIVARFARSATLARQAGFGGLQIHGAHGYLVSQFLSPLTNRRDDAWGGTPEKRRRFVLAVVAAIRDAVGRDFPVAIKLNSADFQRGGFEADEALDVVVALEAAGIDLIEISGGTYEAPVMVGRGPVRASTAAREAYFLEFAARARALARVPLMVTGGFRTLAGMVDAVAGGAVDVVGLARPLALEPALPARLLAGDVTAVRDVEVRTGLQRLDGYLQVAWHAQQLQRMGRGLDPDPGRPAWLAAAIALIDNGWEVLGARRGTAS